MTTETQETPVAGSPPQWPMDPVPGGHRFIPGVPMETEDTRRAGVPGAAPPRAEQPPAVPTTHEIQAAAEGVDAAVTAEFKGRRFRLAESVGLAPLMRFAQAARGGLNTDDMDGLAAMQEVVKDCIYRPLLTEPDMLPVEGADQLVPNPKAGQVMTDPDTGLPVRDEREWEQFDRWATAWRAEDEDYEAFLQAAIEAISARPKKRRGNSSDGSPATSPKSRAGFSSPIPQRPGADELTPVAELGR
jgi:hypothetical protein